MVLEGRIRASLPLPAGPLRHRDLDDDVVAGGIMGRERPHRRVVWPEVQGHRYLGTRRVEDL